MNTALAIYENFDKTNQVAHSLAASDLIPPHFQRKPSNVLIALEFAYRVDIAPFQAMQSLFVVHGRVGMAATMAISLARRANVWKKLDYEVVGKNETLEVTAVATLHDGSQVRTMVSYEMAKKAGWTKNAVYQSIPEQMLKYRSAVFLIRTYFPEVLFGMQTVEELEDVEAAKRAQKATPVVKIASMSQVLDVAKNPEEIAKVKAEILNSTVDLAQEIPEPVIEEDTLIENVEIEVERDIEDYRGELREFLATRENAWFERIGKTRGEIVAKVEAETSLDKMKHFYDFIQKIGG